MSRSQSLRKTLDAVFTPEKQRELLEEAINSTRDVWMTCKQCGRFRAAAELPDWNARAAFLRLFLEAADGKPGQSTPSKPTAADALGKPVKDLSDDELAALAGSEPEG